MAKMNHIMIGYKGQYCSYDDSDIMTDYFHGYHLNNREACAWLQRDGARVVDVIITSPALFKIAVRRIKQFCFAAGYDHEERHRRANDGERMIYEWRMTRIKGEK